MTAAGLGNRLKTVFPFYIISHFNLILFDSCGDHMRDQLDSSRPCKQVLSIPNSNPLRNEIFSRVQQKYFSLSERDLQARTLPVLGSLRYHEGDGGEKRCLKANSRSFQLAVTFIKCKRTLFCRSIRKNRILLQKEKGEFRRRLFTSSIKREIRYFHVVVVQ